MVTQAGVRACSTPQSIPLTAGAGHDARRRRLSSSPVPARGMGRAYVRGPGARARIVATDRSWAPSGARVTMSTSAEVSSRDDVLAEVMDISIDSHVKRVYAAAMDRFGTIDVVINNAGLRQRDLYPPHGSVATLDTEIGDWQAMFETHVFGSLRVIKSFVQPMLAMRRGSIVCVASDGFDGHRPQSREMPYQSAKAGMVTLRCTWRRSCAESNIAVNVLLPAHAQYGVGRAGGGTRGDARPVGSARLRAKATQARARGAAGVVSRSNNRPQGGSRVRC